MGISLAAIGLKFNGIIDVNRILAERLPMIFQASAVPFRFRDNALEFCLITSIKKGRWGFPKGIIDPGETHVETALKEAEEEAGLHGCIVGEPLGEYTYAKWGTTLQVTVVLMEVSRADDEWHEVDVRKRRWVSPDEARHRLTKAELRDMLDAAIARLGADNARA